MRELRRALASSMGDLGLEPPAEELAGRVEIYIRELRKWRVSINLMGDGAVEGIVRLHFLEAFWAADRFLGGKESVADIGSGAGFPGLAMKIYRPDLRMTLLERTYKKCVFLDATAKRLELDVSIRHGAAEDWDGWDSVDCASLRAVRPDAGLLAPLERARVALLHFRGGEAATFPDSWILTREELYPAADNRWVGLYRVRSRND